MAEFSKTGHRQRLRERFLAGEASVQTDAALLELLLSYAIPRIDVQPLATQLIAEFGNLHGVLGTYAGLAAFAEKLRQVRAPDGRRFPQPLSVNRGILDAIPEAEFHTLVEDEAKRPEPTAAHVARAFEVFLRTQLLGNVLVILAHLEMERILTIAVCYREGRQPIRKVQTHRFTMRLNAKRIVRRVPAHLGNILGLTPKSMR